MKLHLKPITPENWRTFNALKVKKEQAQWVASNELILARAYVYREYNSNVFAIYASNTPIGLLMQRDHIDNGKTFCILDQIMIDEQYQGCGYGKVAMKQWISLIKENKKYESIKLCYKEEDIIAYNLYRDLGFQYTGEIDEDEITMEYKMFSID
ncbi:GNAT family N-acetyltransferase [Solibacillus sp. MA9]|uniref:GNAT family N-acetyltransferase n=1 Tax=Solibacillus palustris TaxID=2908203 RepID=A0ABS9U8L4_9BACL|nr:GNAT family N-acetyltransferase [Solibacillus sp. MA9]MCH7320691.1 GNAT family N-acetyltransferase [Solibacillus sp. MA9]